LTTSTKIKNREKSYSENRFHINRVFCEIKNLYVDILYGKPLIGTIKSSKAGHTYVSNTDYSVIKWISKVISKSSSNKVSIVDIGCGKGRALNGFHHYLKSSREVKVIGLEYEESIAKEAQRRCEKYSFISVLHGDATIELPQLSDECQNFIYLYNPFSDEKILQAFLKNFLEQYSSLQTYPTIIYYCPRKIFVFENMDRFDIKEEVEQNLVPWKVDDIYRRVAFITAK
jgi:SAM-dependent methyltransferase